MRGRIHITMDSLSVYELLGICQYLHIRDIGALLATGKHTAGALSPYMGTSHSHISRTLRCGYMKYHHISWPELNRNKCIVEMSVDLCDVITDRQLTYDYTGIITIKGEHDCIYVYARDGITTCDILCQHPYKGYSTRILGHEYYISERSVGSISVRRAVHPIHYSRYISKIIYKPFGSNLIASDYNSQTIIRQMTHCVCELPREELINLLQ